MGMNNWGGITEHMFVKPRNGAFRFLRKYNIDSSRKRKIKPGQEPYLHPLESRGTNIWAERLIKTIGVFLVIGTLLLGFTMYKFLFLNNKEETVKLVFISAEDEGLSLNEVSQKHEKYIYMTSHFKRLIAFGDASFEKGNYKKAINYYFNAKTIYPEDAEVRLKLISTFVAACRATGKYCGNAQKEIQAAKRYVKQSDSPSLEIRLKELDNSLAASL
ncbi:MAG: hypothetical protein AAF502_06455 [Bacteroidota bacterium]